MVYYRKYRPQTIQDLDSKEAREKLTAVLSSASIPHAFLFTGPKGLGKTSSARIVAKAVNCEEKSKINPSTPLRTGNQKSKVQIKNQKGEEVNIEPCNKCSQCISITNGSNVDVLEIDGASNRGIDEIRDLREKIRLSPVSAKKKVYIIDEVHMLTTEAFNALLKTLEEPPAHGLFVLCTTEPHKVPATIASRCFHIAFTRATTDELVRSLSRIVKGEKLAISEDSLRLIANRADGSFRDAAKSLEELVLGSGGEKITKDFVEEKLKTTNIGSHIQTLLESLQKKDAKGALTVVDAIAVQGTDMKFVIEELVGALHGALLEKVGIGKPSPFLSSFTIEEIKELVTLFTKAYQDLRFAVIAQLPLEIAVIEFVGNVGRTPHAASDALQPLSEDTTQASSSLSERRSPKESSASNKKSESAFNSLAGGDATANNRQLLLQLIDKVKQQNHSLAGVLRGCFVQKQENGELVLATNFQFHKERLEDAKSLAILEKAAKEVLGNNVAVSIILNSRGGDL